MAKALIAALAATLALGACTSSSDDVDPTPNSTEVTTSETTPEPTDDESTEPTPTETPSPDGDREGGETEEPTPTESPDREYTPATEASKSENWPDITAQALPAVVTNDGTSLTVEYDSDGTGELEWHADGWADKAYEDGSGFEIDLGTQRALQIWVSGIRYPQPDEEFAFADETGSDGPILSYDVSGPFEGMHSITIGADEDHDYAVEVSENPLAITIYLDAP